MARTLGRMWEETLLQRALEEDYTRFQQAQPHGLTAAERAEIETLARNPPTIWRSPQIGVAIERFGEQSKVAARNRRIADHDCSRGLYRPFGKMSP